jgi:hypothetical protein
VRKQRKIEARLRSGKRMTGETRERLLDELHLSRLHFECLACGD